ncbi:MAG: hypothetical protein ACYTJ0_17850, partial [Planctomycetota bacterium]
VFGNVADAANPALQSTTCSVPQPIQPGATYACSFIAEVTGNAGEIEIDLVTASGVDDDDTPVSDSATATVTVTGVPPAITVSKSAVPISLPEPGGSVTFTVRVDNASTAEDPVTIDSLSDTVYGDLTDVGDEGGTAKGQTGTSCILPQTIPPGQFYECAFSSQVTGNKDFTETNTITASGQDDDGVATSAGASATVTITGADPSVVVTKTATPMLLPEPGGTVTFMITVENSSQTTDPVTLTALDDDVYGDLTEIGDEGGAAKPQMSTTCVLPQTIQPAATWGCSFTAEVTGAAGFSETDTVTASGADDESVAVVGNDSATVTVTDLPPSIAVAKMAAPASLDEPGGAVTFTVRIDNTSGQGDEVTITSLTDDVYGDLTDPSDEGATAKPQTGTTCSLPQAIPPAGFYECTFTADVLGEPGFVEVDTVTATGQDEEDNPAADSGSAMVTINGLDPALTVTKTASPTSVPEPAGTVTFTVRIDNTSGQADPVTVSSLVDSIHGPLDGQGSCALPQTIQPGAFYECSFDAQVAGNAGDFETDTVTASGSDDDGAAVNAFDSATVTVSGTDPLILVAKTAAPSSLPEPGGTVTFTVRIDNASNGQDPVEITGLVDDVYGNVTDGANPLLQSTTCVLPQILQPGAFYECAFEAEVAGDAGDLLTDTVTASGEDDDGSPVAVSASASVTLSDVVPVIGVTKTASPPSVPEPGDEVTFSVVVTNDSVSSDALTLDSLVDDLRGDVADGGNPALVSTTCAVPQEIASGASYACQFTAFVGGNAGDSETDNLTATCRDDEGNGVNGADAATVDITDATAALTVTKTAVPADLPAPGGTVIFTVEILNASGSTDPVTLNTLIDDVHGDLDGRGSCLVPQNLAPGSSYACSFETSFVGAEGDSETDTVTAEGVDDEGTAVGGMASATVTLTDAQPVLTVVKTATPTSVFEPGGQVTFDIEITNDSVAED